jgi:hypothetical protein
MFQFCDLVLCLRMHENCRAEFPCCDQIFFVVFCISMPTNALESARFINGLCSGSKKRIVYSVKLSCGVISE